MLSFDASSSRVALSLPLAGRVNLSSFWHRSGALWPNLRAGAQCRPDVWGRLSFFGPLELHGLLRRIENSNHPLGAGMEVDVLNLNGLLVASHVGRETGGVITMTSGVQPLTCACTACSPTNANPGPSMMSHGLIVVPRSLRMFQRERRSNKPASAGGFRQHLESRCWKRPLRGWSLGRGSLAPRALRSERDQPALGRAGGSCRVVTSG